MTVQELTERYFADLNAVKELREAEKIDNFQYEDTIRMLDDKLFESLGIFTSFEASTVVNRINEYAL